MLADLLRRRLLRLRGDLASYEAGLDAVTAKDLPEAYWLDLTYLRDSAGRTGRLAEPAPSTGWSRANSAGIRRPTSRIHRPREEPKDLS